MQITVENVEYPSEGRKTGSIKAGGRFYKAWPDKLDEFTIGLTYDVEVEESVYQGKTQNWIKKKPKLVGPNTVGAIIPQPNGQHAPTGTYPVVQPPRQNGYVDKDVLITTVALMKSFIETGQQPPEDLTALEELCLASAKRLVKAAS